MDTDDDLFLDAVGAMVLDALARIGDDPKARYAFFKRLLAVAQATAGNREPTAGQLGCDIPRSCDG